MLVNVPVQSLLALFKDFTDKVKVLVLLMSANAIGRCSSNAVGCGHVSEYAKNDMVMVKCSVARETRRTRLIESPHHHLLVGAEQHFAALNLHLPVSVSKHDQPWNCE